jgi:hypothetical protein
VFHANRKETLKVNFIRGMIDFFREFLSMPAAAAEEG